MSVVFDWKARVDSALELAASRRRPQLGNARITFRSPATPIIAAAAQRRGITPAAFARRATLAMAAQVLGVAFEDLCAVDATVQLPGHSPAADPTGRVGGPWEIAAFKDPME